MLRRRGDGPRLRYEMALRRGESKEGAAATVASSYGLIAVVVALRPDGQKSNLAMNWTIEQIERIYFLRECAAKGWIGGREH